MNKFKQIILTVLLCAAGMTAWAYDFMKDGIYYNITSNAEPYTVEVTSSPNSYSGNVVIPESVTYNSKTYLVTFIGNSAFYDCIGLTSVSIPNTVTLIENLAFYGCTSLTSVSIPNSVTSIGTYVFDNTGWYNNQPDGILYLGDWCLGYKGEKPVGILSIKEGTIGIACSAFYDCTDITSVTIPNSVTSIGSSTFYGCTGLATVTIPNSVTSIMDGAFSGCTSLTTVTIPNSVTTIGWSVFEGCTNLTSVTIPNSVTSVGGGVYNNTGWYNNQPDGILYLDGWCLGYKGEKPVGILSIEEGIIGIAGYAFYDCSDITFITIPNSVTTIGGEAFMFCTGLTSITIPNSVTSIEFLVFYDCSNIDTIIALGTMPPTLEAGAFSGISSEAVLFVPCGTTTSYSQQFNMFNMFDPNNIYDDCNSYPVTVNPTGSTGGEISVSANSAQLGEDVEVYVTLEDGYVVESIVAYNANNPSQIVPISLAGAKDVLTYSFVMMPFPVNVEATFVKGTTGIGEENGNIATSLYPNPTNGKVTIEAENMHRVCVFNLMGQKIMESTASGNSFECDMSRYGTGVYMMQIETSNGIATKRVVVEK